ncbi:MAG: 50S ribosomal protein L11 methyltransferase [Bacillota bacterium]|nr:50S ribosomal protein L11 methyltransferase [Bacillota bacterium]
MKWKEYSVLTGANCVDSIAEVFHRLGSGGVIVEEPQAARGYSTMDNLDGDELNLDFTDHEFVVIKAYFSEDQDVYSELADCIKRVEASYQIQCRVVLNEVKDEDWESTWKEFYHTFTVGQRLVIKPSWEPYQTVKDEIVVEIDPGMAFGTGAHASTRLCLQLMDKYLQGEEHVIDAGCGSGILSIAAAKLGAKQVTAMDIDELAVQISHDNVRLNQLEDKIQVMNANIIEVSLEHEAEMMLANLTADVILDLVPGVRPLLKPEGILIGSGIIDSRWPQVKKKLYECEFEIIDIVQETDWVGFAAKRKQ